MFMANRLRIVIVASILFSFGRIVQPQDVPLLNSDYLRFAALSKEEVRALIELSPDQANELKRLSRERGFDQLRYEQTLADLPREEAFKLSNEYLKEKNSQLYKESVRVLIPQQMNRLNQIANQEYFRIRLKGETDLKRFAKYLKLSDAQQGSFDEISKETREKESAIRDRLTQARREMQEKARKAILDLLTEDQREQLRSLMGKPFDFTGIFMINADPFRELRQGENVISFSAWQPIDKLKMDEGFWQSFERQTLLNAKQTKILEELDVSPKQLDEIGKVDKKLLELNKSLRIGEVGKRPEGVDDVMAEYGDILLMHQISRAKELAIQLKVTSGRAGMGYDLFSAELKYSQEQAHDVKKIIDQLYEDLLQSQRDAAGDMLEVSQEYYKAFLELLSMDQKEKARNLIGDLFIPEYELELEKRVEARAAEELRKKMREAARKEGQGDPGK